ncbi:hypothetical protein LBMAG53_13020 [Planctomycetota bacterium]|nr:hypothetical protein LBMAG53_13020 [Planctomycetota bacterium]
MIKRLAFLCPSVLACVALGAVEQNQRPVPAGAAVKIIFADHTAGSAAELPAPTLAAIRGRAVALAYPSQHQALAQGLDELAGKDPRFALRSATSPKADWYANGGGVGRFAAGGTNKLTARLDSIAANLVDVLPKLAIAQVQSDANDVPSGRRIETGYTQYSATMDVRFTSSKLEGLFVEELTAYRRIGNVLILDPVTYPLELPNFAIDHVSVTARVPIGLATPEPGAVQGAGAGNTLAKNDQQPWPRDPRVAFAAYRDSMEKLEKSHPGTAFVWTTMPLTAADNLQRSWFNLQVRNYAVHFGKPLFDLAAVQSHGPDGRVRYDDQGEVLAKEWTESGSTVAMNAAGRAKLANAWWWLMAKLDGFEAKAAGDPAPGSVTGLSGG